MDADIKGHKNAGWDDFAGVYGPRRQAATVGKNARLAPDYVALHEFGHAVDDFDGITYSRNSPTSAALRDAHARLFPKLRTYIQQGEPGSDRGASELWADGFAAYYMGGKANVAANYDQEFADMMQQMLDAVAANAREEGF